MKRPARRRARPEQLLQHAATPIFLVGIDRRVISFNSGCEQLTGWSTAEIVGQLCEFATDPESSVESLASSLCPPPEVFAGRSLTLAALIAHRTSEPQSRTVQYVPLLAEDGTVTAVLGIVTDEPPEKAASIGRGVEIHAELAALRHALRRRFGTQALVCKSEGMLRVIEQLSIARETDAAVLIHGEAGSGREHVARAIHYEGRARNRSFVPLDCRQLSALELQQTLRRFLDTPHEDDASEAITALKPGTIFLSHVDWLPRDVQQTVVEAFRSGSARQHKLRLIASTSREPAEFSDREQFRADFYHLITPLCIAVPPLRRRADDLPLLAQHLLEELNRGEARQIGGFADDVWEKLTEYNWPGNVDELLAVIREARADCHEPLIGLKNLPFRFRTGLSSQSVGPVLRPQVVLLEPYLAKAEKEQIERALAECRQNKSKAAELLGLTRARLYRRMESLGILDEPESA